MIANFHQVAVQECCLHEDYRLPSAQLLGGFEIAIIMLVMMVSNIALTTV